MHTSHMLYIFLKSHVAKCVIFFASFGFEEKTLTAGRSNNSDPLHSADDGISNHDSLSKHLFCTHCEEILATTYLHRSLGQQKMRM